jgi:hypothetical protein
LSCLLLLAVGWRLVAPHAKPAEARLRSILLVVLGAVSLLAWPNLLNFHYHGAVHKWEFFHYYLGAKYLPELGYTRLYLCATVVDVEDGLELRGPKLRDLRDNQFVPIASVLGRAGECRSRFSAQRWDLFRHDVRFFREAMGQQAWTAVRTDHGFNGTPAWAVLAGLLAGLAPAAWPQIILLSLLDVALLVATLVVFVRVFGLEAACIAAGYWGVNALAPFGWTGGGFLRYDWLFWLVLGLACLRAERRALAGFALGFAALLRVFPVFAILGLGLSAAAAAIRERSARPILRQFPFAAGVAGAVLLLFTSSSLMAGGAGIWREFAVNIVKHMDSQAGNSVGLGAFVAHQHEARAELLTDPLLNDPEAPWRNQRSRLAREMRPAVWLASAGFALLLVLAARDRPDWVAAILGIGLLPIVLAVSCYYYSVLIVYAALWAIRPGVGLGLVSLAWLSTLVVRLWSGEEQYAWLSLAVVLFVAAVTARLAWPQAPAADARENPPL